IAFAKEQPTSRDPIRPGPWHTATPDSSSSLTSTVFNASSTTGHIISMCRRDASSGTMPPYFLCISVWLEIILEIIFVPFSTTDADVSSQDVSIPRISIGLKDYAHIWLCPLVMKVQKNCPLTLY